MSSPIVVTNTNKRIFDLDDHYRQVLNTKLDFDKGYGWIGMGVQYLGSSMSTIERLTYSNDTSLSLRGSGTLAKSLHTAIGNETHGWFISGATNHSDPNNNITTRIDRVTYSNDMTTASLRGNSVLGTIYSTTGGNNTMGWVIAGETLPSGIVSNITRITYASDNTTSTIRGNSINSVRMAASTSNTTDAWVFGGFAGGGETSIVSRLTFSTDNGTTTQRTTHGPTQGPGASSNTTDAWVYGGISGYYLLSSITRISFANDTGVFSLRGNIWTPSMNISCTGNNEMVWGVTGDYTGPSTSGIFRNIYANDTATADRRLNMSPNRSRAKTT